MSAAPARAAILAAPRTLRFQEVAVPDPGPREVLVRLGGSGVCASNLPVWEGRPWFTYPLAPGAPGHEAWGVVEEIGRGVVEVAPGDPVALLSENAFADRQVAPVDRVVRLPETLRGADFPGESAGCAMNVFSRSRISGGQTVAVVGVGFLGAIVTRLASAAGARVIAFSRRPFARALALSCGAEAAFPMDDRAAAVREVAERTSGRLCDRAIECVGEQEPLDLAGELTREHGLLVIAGYHQDGPRQVNLQLWNWRGFDVVNAHERDPIVALEGIRSAARAVAKSTLDLAPLLTAFPFERLGEAIEAARTRPDGFVKAVVRA